MLRIVSWNAQGAARSKIPSIFSKLLESNKNNLLLVHEAGSPKQFDFSENTATYFEWKIGHENYTGLIVPQPYAVNKRCSVAMLKNTEEIFELRHIQFENVRRPILIAHHKENLSIATWHATAACRPIWDEFEVVRRFMNDNFEKWIFMGDFNIDGGLFKERCGVNAVIPSDSTHFGGKRLDYAYVSDRLLDYGIGPLEILDGGDSDHFPTCLTVKTSLLEESD